MAIIGEDIELVFEEIYRGVFFLNSAFLARQNEYFGQF